MRAKTIKNLYDKKIKTYAFTGAWKQAMGEPGVSGAWIIYGPEKNGKTWFALMLANYLSTFNRVLYISAEEGTDGYFIDACKRAKLDVTNKRLKIIEYVTLEELEEELDKRTGFEIVFIDNLTIYNEDFKYGRFRKLLRKYPNVLFVCLAHEEKNEPYTSTAKMCRKLAKIIVRVRGLAAEVSGRCPGGVLLIDEHKAQIYWGTQITQQTKEDATETTHSDKDKL